MSASTKDTDVARAVASRRANTYLRLGTTLAICVILDRFTGMRWIWIWGALYTAIQLLETWLAIRIIKQGRSDNGPWPRLSVMALPFLTSAAFGFLAIPLFASDARFAPTLGGMLLAGALMNVVIVNGSLRSATIAAAAPHIFYLLIIPIIARQANPDAPLASALWFGALLLIAAVAVAARTLRAALKAEADAKTEAERRRHEAEEAVAAKSAFVAMISHELRTPISAILAGAARLHSEVPEASSKVHAQLIADAGGLMRTLLNDLLDFSRLEAGRMSVEKAPFNLRQSLSDTLRLWRPELAREGLKLRVIGASAIPQWVIGDAMRLKQVLNNLLSNAAKFTSRGGVSVTLATETVGDQVRLLIEVVDTGPGIPEEALPRLFTPFDQLNASVVRQHGGSGLGLAISRELARLMGGDLVAANGRSQGACFRLSVLLEATEAPDVPIPGPSISGLQVLVVDDHVVNRRAIELVLQPFGVEATLAESGEEALELLGSEVFDAILMDVYMPGMDGRETTRALRAGAGPNRDAPVIAVTASATIKDWEACAAAGMNAHVAKPIDPTELFSALAQVMAARSDVGPIGSEVVASSA
ncbi:hybrid sensor histidine kinase/response regulator [Caulobacter vibrioides]|uniref:histidine kinase n=1 Tax=Caulobacter vibrioides TaxID=155892 RepID=A0A290MP28_CAUVI|nr:ATP-binding protein [Caulobacter vibrioides]ATC33739.1 hybrid sensor histidine kinase/response regulator [Caulobacter vibrioides]